MSTFSHKSRSPILSDAEHLEPFNGKSHCLVDCSQDRLLCLAVEGISLYFVVKTMNSQPVLFPFWIAHGISRRVVETCQHQLEGCGDGGGRVWSFKCLKLWWWWAGLVF